MPFTSAIRDAIDKYVQQDLDGDLDSHISYFDFLSLDPDLQRRVGEEYFSARYLYKFFEGMRIPDDWARRAQIQIQVQQYASIYEACLHHLVFARAAPHEATLGLLRIKTLRRWSVSTDLQNQLASLRGPDGREVVAAIESYIRLEESKVRFDSKARAAVEIGIIERSLADELIQFYAARNMIHIHAELKKGADWSWEIEFSKRAYWRLEKFSEQARAWVDTQHSSSAVSYTHLTLPTN
jgi:hypothetical protein